MAKINIVLLEPQIPQNTGNIARTCAICGATLHLIEPMGFKVTDKNLKRAGLDYWSSVEVLYYKDLEDFFNRNEGKYYFFSTKGKMIYSDIKFNIDKNSYLFFGREDAGLPKDLLAANTQSIYRIPMGGELRSLNLSNSAAIVVYELLRQWGFPTMA